MESLKLNLKIAEDANVSKEERKQCEELTMRGLMVNVTAFAVYIRENEVYVGVDADKYILAEEINKLGVLDFIDAKPFKVRIRRIMKPDTIGLEDWHFKPGLRSKKVK